MSRLLAEIRERGRRLVPSLPSAEVVAQRGALGALLDAPRAVAAVVIGMLGFGALVGSVVGGASASDPGTIVAVVSPPASTDASPPSSDAGPTPRVVTRTITVGSGAAAPTPAAAGTKTKPAEAPVVPPAPTLPPIKHVFLIVLSNQGYSQSFGNSAAAPYVARTLAARGEVISNYYSVAGGSLANEIALVSGQGPTPETVQNCPVFAPVAPATVEEDGQVHGTGCGYPLGVITIGDELKSADLEWKAYLQADDTGDDPQTERCRPQPGSSPDDPDHPYAAWRNPFVYFGTGATGDPCLEENAGLDELAKDLRSQDDTPALSYIVPDLCHSGDATPCAPDAKSGMEAADEFLSTVVPQIEKSPAYRSGGLIAITFDQAPQTGPGADSSSCCAQPAYPNLSGPSTDGSDPAAPADPGTTTPTETTTTTTPVEGLVTTVESALPTSTATTETTTTDTPTTTPPAETADCPAADPGTTSADPTTTTATTTDTTETAPPATETDCPPADDGQPRGGGQVGLLLLSKFVKPGTINGFDLFNHYSLLASIQDLFGLDRLGYAAQPGLPIFGSSVYTAFP